MIAAGLLVVTLVGLLVTLPAELAEAPGQQTIELNPSKPHTVGGCPRFKSCCAAGQFVSKRQIPLTPPRAEHDCPVHTTIKYTII